MAQGFRWWTRIVPPAIERSTFVLVSSLVLLLLTGSGGRCLPGSDGDPSHAPEAVSCSAGHCCLPAPSCSAISVAGLVGLRGCRQDRRRRRFTRRCSTGWCAIRSIELLLAFWATIDDRGHLLFAVATTGLS
jgi:hypothetical protein